MEKEQLVKSMQAAAVWLIQFSHDAVVEVSWPGRLQVGIETFDLPLDPKVQGMVKELVEIQRRLGKLTQQNVFAFVLVAGAEIADVKLPWPDKAGKPKPAGSRRRSVRRSKRRTH